MLSRIQPKEIIFITFLESSLKLTTWVFRLPSEHATYCGPHGVAFSQRGAPGSCAWPLCPALLSPLWGPDVHQGQNGDIDYSGQSLVEKTKEQKCAKIIIQIWDVQTVFFFFFGQLLFLYRFLAYEDEGA